MLTPIEIQNKTFKTGFGYDKKDVEGFIKEVVKDYEVLYKDNIELNDKINVLSEGVQYYKSIEKTLQKALVLAQKAAQETEANATAKAENIVAKATNSAAMIEDEAKQKAKKIKETATEQADNLVSEARKELQQIQIDVANLLQQYDKYKVQCMKLIEAQKEIMESPAFNVDYSNFVTFHSFIASKAEDRELTLPEGEEETSKEDKVEKKEVIEEIEAQTVTEEKTVTEEIKEDAVKVIETPIEVKEEVKEEKKEETLETVESAETEPTLPELDLTGVLDDIPAEETTEPADDNAGMKELTTENAKEGFQTDLSLEQTLNEMSEKELLMKLFSSVNESELKPDTTDTKEDFEFLDL